MTLSLGSVSLRVEIDARYLHESLQKAIKSFKAPDAKLSIDSVEALRDAKLFRAKVSAPIIIPVQLSLSAATKQYEEFARATAKLDPFKSIAASKKKLAEGKTAIAVSLDGAQLEDGLSRLRQRVRSRGAGFFSGLAGMAGGALDALGGALSAYSSLQSAKARIEVLLDKDGAIKQYKELVERLGAIDRPFKIPMVLNDREPKTQASAVRRILDSLQSAAMRMKAALGGGVASLKEEAFTDPFLAMRKAIQAARAAFSGLRANVVDAGSDITGFKSKVASLQSVGARTIGGLGDGVVGFRQKILDATGSTTSLGAAIRGAFSASAIGGFVVGVTGAVKGIQMLHQPLGRLNQMLAGLSRQSFEFARSATEAAAEVDGALRRANAIAGGTTKTYEALFETAIKTGADSGVLVSTKDAALAMETLAKRGKTIEQMISTSLGLAQLSTATGEKMPALTGNFLDTAGKFNLSAKEMELAVKSLSGVLTTGAKSQDAAYFAKYFTPAKQGLEAYREMLEVQSLLSTAGIRGSNAATSTNRELANLTKSRKLKGGKRTTTFADILGVKATEADGKTMRSQLDILLDAAKKYREYVERQGELQASSDARFFLGENGSRALKNFSKLTEEQIARSIKAVDDGAAKMNRVSADALKQIGVGSIAVQNSLESLKISMGRSFAPVFNAISMGWSDLLNRMSTLPILKQIEALSSTIATALARPEIAASIKKLQDLLLGLVTSGLNLVLKGVQSFLAFLADTSAVDRFVDAMRMADQAIRGVGRALAWVYSMEVKVAGAMAARIVQTGKTGQMDARIGKVPDTADLAKKMGLGFNPFEGLGKLSFSFGADFQQSIKNLGIALAPVVSALKDLVIQLGPPLLSAIGGILKGLTALLIPLGELLATAIRIVTIKLTPFVHKIGLIGRAFGEVGQVIGVTLGTLLGFVTEGTKVVQGFVNGVAVSMAAPFHTLLDLSSRGTSALAGMLARFRLGLSQFGDWAAGWAQVLGSIVGVLKNLGLNSIGSVLAAGRSALNLLSVGVRGVQASLATLGNFVSGVLTGRVNVFAVFTRASLGSIRTASAGLLTSTSKVQTGNDPATGRSHGCCGAATLPLHG